MKILYVISNLVNEGPVNQLLGQIKGNTNIKYYIVTLFKEEAISKIDDFKKAGVSIETLGYISKLQVFLPQIKLSRIIQREKPNIIHSATLSGDIAVKNTWCNNIPWICTIHCNIFTDYLMGFNPLLAKINVWLHMMALKRVNAIIACSFYLQKVYKKVNVCYCIQNGIDTEQYNIISQKQKETLRKSLNLPNDKTIIIVSGSMDDRKNSKWILNTFIKHNNDNNKMLLFIGNGPQLEECKKIANNNPCVRFEGKVRNVDAYLKCSDIYLSASKSEGLPLSVLEGLSCGLHSLLSDIPQHKEIISKFQYKDDFVKIFKNNNTDDFCQKLDTLINHMLNEKKIDYQIAAHKYVLTHFSNEIMGEKYMQVYKSVLKKAGIIF